MKLNDASYSLGSGLMFMACRPFILTSRRPIHSDRGSLTHTIVSFNVFQIIAHHLSRLSPHSLCNCRIADTRQGLQPWPFFPIAPNATANKRSRFYRLLFREDDWIWERKFYSTQNSIFTLTQKDDPEEGWLIMLIGFGSSLVLSLFFKLNSDSHPIFQMVPLLSSSDNRRWCRRIGGWDFLWEWL